MTPGDFHLRLARDAVAAAGERAAFVGPAGASPGQRTAHLRAARAWLRAAAKNLALAEAEFARPLRRAKDAPHARVLRRAKMRRG